MSEYIITDKQLKTATEAYLEHELSRPITEVFISGDKLPQIVRCRDCKHYRDRINGCAEFGDESRDEYANVDPNGYCAWGKRRGE